MGAIYIVLVFGSFFKFETVYPSPDGLRGLRFVTILEKKGSPVYFFALFIVSYDWPNSVNLILNKTKASGVNRIR